MSPLTTERLLLRELTCADASDCNAYERDPEVVRYTSHGVRTLDESLAYLRRNLASLHESPRRTFDFAVVLTGEGRLVGRAGIHVTQPDLREATIWYILDRSRWGKGIVPEAARALLAFGFGELGLHRIYADLDPRNHASARVAEKIGMRREAHFVANAWIKGEWMDTLIYAILDHEWPPRQSGVAP